MWPLSLFFLYIQNTSSIRRTEISKHINSIYKEEELDEKSTCAKNAQVLPLLSNSNIHSVKEDIKSILDGDIHI